MTDLSRRPSEPSRAASILAELTIEEKAALTAGSGYFTMPGVTRLGLVEQGTTDGPNGARGSSFLGSGESKATCIPSGSALGATWDVALVEALGVLLGRETRTKQSRVLLAPTVNLHRSPLAGRNFECFSEDPLLSGALAAAYVRGVQTQAVITTVKHFVGNEAETDRYTSDSQIGARALRELYLVPFEMAVREGGTLGVMSAYNRVNGEWVNNQRELLTGILREEWGFEGFVTTDWLAGADTVDAAHAGLDIEMPLGNRAYGTALAEAVLDGRVPEHELDAAALHVLEAFERVGAWSDERGAEQSIDLPEHRALARRAAAGAMVLLRNEPLEGRPLLPLDPAAPPRIALIGPNARRAQIMGGGSANLRPFHRTSPLAALRARFGEQLELVYESGCSIDKVAPLLSAELVGLDGEPGFTVEVFDNASWSGTPARVTTRDTSRLMFGDESLARVEFSARATAAYTPSESGDHVFELHQVAPTRVLLDGEVIIDGISGRLPRSTAFFGFGRGPGTATVELEAGRSYELVVEMTAAQLIAFAGCDLGVRRPIGEDALGRAVAAAASADVAIVVVGTNDDWETEGEDRTSLSLPGEQDALVRAVAAANPATVVVVNTGAPVTMPWAEEVPAILQCWFGGQEMSAALVDVLFGESDPGGRLPTTFPMAIEHTPSFGNFPGENGAVRYAEDVFIGYRWYDTRRIPVLFPFGHGLSYTSFQVDEARLTPASLSVGDLAGGATVELSVRVTNRGERRGSEVVQCYVRPSRSRLPRPVQELKAFGKVELEPGQSARVTLTLTERAFAYWDPGQPEWPTVQARAATTLPQLQGEQRRTTAGWVVEPGEYELVLARSATDPLGSTTMTITA